MHSVQCDIAAALLKSLHSQRLITENAYMDALKRLPSILDNNPDCLYNRTQQNDNSEVEQYECP